MSLCQRRRRPFGPRRCRDTAQPWTPPPAGELSYQAALRPRTPARDARLGRLGVGRHDPLPAYSGPRLRIWGFQNGTARSSATTTA